jgi:hypothetical protein
MRAARKVLERLEDSLRTAVESVGRLLPGKLEPLEMAAELARAMDHSALEVADGVFAANEYLLRAAPADLELLGGLVGELEAELAVALREHACEREYVLGPRVRVRMVGDQQVSSGRLRVETSFAEEALPARLTIVGGLSPCTFDFAGEVVLGRGGECEICLDETAISRRHARVYWTYPGYVVEDLSSVNGTFVNGEMVQRRLLHGGEILEVGLVQLRFNYLQD